MDDKYRLLQLGALLHDIGKIVQRDIGKKEGNHSELGYKFLKGWSEDIARFAKFHHKDEIPNPDFERLNIVQQNLLWMVYEADNLSSIERGEKEGEFNPKNPLISIFSSIRGIKSKIDEHKIKARAYPLTMLDFDNFVFPGFEKDKAEDRIPHKSYEKIYEEFKHKFPDLHPDLMLAFLEKVATFIPARTGGNENISLFDHLKTTCAIASCMYLYHKNELDKDIKNEILDRTKEKYLLISGDISGIQKFIYNITSKGALKLLRARSFFLEMISEDFVQELLDELKLSRTNLLYCAGGHFYILAPNIDEVKQKIGNLKRTLNEWLFNRFEGNLYYAVDYLPFEGLKFKNFSKVWEEIGKRLAEDKSTKFKEFLLEKPNQFLREDCRDREYHNKKELCDACKVFVSKVFPVDDKKYCDLCYKLFEVGKKLADKNKFYILRYKEISSSDLELPFSHIKIERGIKDIERENFNTLFQINSLEINEILKLKNGREFTFVVLAFSNYSSGKDLDKLAEDSEGIKKIGILRMDVDDLGRIFREGLPEELRTISRITNISRFLNYFFKGYLNLLGKFKDRNVIGICSSIWGNGRLKARRNRDFTIVYAGGDDLLIVGGWDDVFELAFDINALFRKYVGENDNITISASFCIFDPKFPFYKMAEISGIKEDIAKDEGKNRIWMFDRGIKNEFKEKHGFKESIEWEKFLQVWRDVFPLLNKASRGTITKLFRINNLYKEYPNKILWAVNLAYWYGRLEENEKKKFEIIMERYSKIDVRQISVIYHIDVPLRIADFAARGE